MSGVLYGIGVGPGDPELLTLKAARLIREADVVFVPAGNPGRARLIVAEHLEGKRVVELQMEMRGDRERALGEAARTVAAELGSGTGVYLTEGDSSLYSTWWLLVDALPRVAPGLAWRTVPGVTSITAAAASAGFRLGIADETIAIVPASAPPALIEDAVSTFDNTIVLKPSLRPDLADRLHRLGILDRAVRVADASGVAEQVLAGGSVGGEGSPYFSTWLVRGGGPPRDRGRVHFVGAGPGAAEHLTRRALSLLRRADLVVAADSLVAPEVIELARGRVIASSGLSLEESVPPMVEEAGRAGVVVRLHSGDPSLYGAVAEQMALLREAGCAYEVVPGVSSVFAAAAALGVELTEAAGSQTVIFSRHGKRVPTPERERLRELAAHGSTLAILLSASAADEVQLELEEAGLDPGTPAAVAYRVSWPDEKVVRTTVGEIAAVIRREGLLRHTLILVGHALDPGSTRSRLYDSGHAHVFRRRSVASAPALERPPAVVSVSKPGQRQAQRIARFLPGAELVNGATALPSLFRQGTPIVAVMPVGIAIRLLAPELRDKRREPAVVVVDDSGRYAVSLLGGRAAGANRLASYVASAIGAEPVVTTSAERLGLPALDETLAELGWLVTPERGLTRLELAVVNGQPLGFYGPGIKPPAGFDFRRVRSLAAASRHAAGLAVSDGELPGLPEGWALARPRRLVLGFGCSTQASATDAVEAARTTLAQANLAPAGVGAVATVERRREHPAALALAQWAGCQLTVYSSQQLDGVPVPNGSERVRAAVGTASVAEAAALLAAAGRLLVPKRATATVTIAVAERPR